MSVPHAVHLLYSCYLPKMPQVARLAGPGSISPCQLWCQSVPAAHWKLAPIPRLLGSNPSSTWNHHRASAAPSILTPAFRKQPTCPSHVKRRKSSRPRRVRIFAKLPIQFTLQNIIRCCRGGISVQYYEQIKRIWSTSCLSWISPILN
jgi:hypothetical protein